MPSEARAPRAAGAVVLAGGKGTRLHPYSALFPKPLMPLGEMPILELVLRQLRSAGIRTVILAVNHLHHLIQSFFNDGAKLGLELRYAIEDQPLGTCGVLGTLLDQLEDDFLVLNGDVLTDLELAAVLACHRAAGADLTVAAQRRTFQVAYGVLELDQDERILGVAEKPTVEHDVAMGIYALRRDALRPHLAPGLHLDMPELIERLVAAGAAVRAFRQPCRWLDIGMPDDYAEAQRLIEADRDAFLPPEPVHAAGSTTRPTSDEHR